MKKFQDKITKRYGLKTDKIITTPALYTSMLPRPNGFLGIRENNLNIYISNTCLISEFRNIKFLSHTRALIWKENTPECILYSLETGLPLSTTYFVNGAALPHDKLEFWRKQNEFPDDNIVGLMCIKTGNIIKEPWATGICPNLDYEDNLIEGFYVVPKKGNEYYCDLEGNKIN